ncbi:MAG: hypothetical protein KC933_13160 [Myxococcales bacterium]|nr:hypothetical protein [Myxococcales bacterium]
MVRRSSPDRLDPQAPDRAPRERERELVLAPNEQAYVLDTTKGHINCYVGPNKTSLAQTDEPVVFSAETGRFEGADLADAVQLFATAPANWYMLLANPAQGDLHPSPGVSNGMVELRVGEKINVFGPASFPLWPGQTVRIIEGHRLRSNQYLVVRIYDAEAVREGFEGPGAPPRLVAGQLLVVRGTDVAFYMPPTGFEVLPDERGRYVRDAVTLQRLEYCVLVREDGKKRYVRGEAVVFPEPDEAFLEEGGARAFPAVELSEITGLYVKITAPYQDEDGTPHHEGEELFLAGRSQIYFPREEHALVRQDGRVVHQAVAIPRGEGRYVLHRITGEVRLVKGPCMFLPDPRFEVLVRRVLTEAERELLGQAPAPALPAPAPVREVEPGPRPAQRALGALDRLPYAPPRALTLGPDPLAAVRVDVPSGFAVQVVDKGEARRVVAGPRSVLLAYDETLEALALSTGTPKTDRAKKRTAFLRLAGNEVSDEVRVETRDMVQARLRVKHRVRFEGEADPSWFAVENYVQLLCDHTRSLIAAQVGQVTIQTLRARAADVVRDAVLGHRADAARPGRTFEDNGMRVVDVEVLALEIDDLEVAELLSEAQMDAIQAAVAVARREATLASQRRVEEVERLLAQEAHETARLRLRLEAAGDAEQHEVARARREAQASLQALARAHELADAQARAAVRAEELTAEATAHRQDLARRADLQGLELGRLEAQVQAAVAQAQAYSPHLVATLDRLADQRLLAALAESFGELAAVEGRGLLETARRYLDFLPASVMPVLARGATPAAERGDGSAS